ncbi:C39 family peptidase [Candidatus Riflebacteria bacterium]
MYFENRYKPPQCSSAYMECREKFLTGRISEARIIAMALRKGMGPQMPADALLCADISRAWGRDREYFATIKIALKRWPTSVPLRILWTRILSCRGYNLKAITILKELLKDATLEAKPFIASLLTSTYAIAGFGESSRKWRAKTIKYLPTRDPGIYYELAFSAIQLQDWDYGIEEGFKTLELAPTWQRSRIFLANALLARGKIQEASKVVVDGMNLGFPDASFEFHAGLQYFIQGELAKSLEIFSDYPKRWPDSDRLKGTEELLTHIYWNLGKYEEARATAKKARPRFFEKFINAGQSGQRKIIPTLIIAQEQLMCVPTAVTMIASAQGVTLNPGKLYKAMKGMNGVLMWRMVAEMEELGFLVRHVKAEAQVIKYFLNLGIPLLAEIEFVNARHVEVVCGFDDDLELFFVRDPAALFPGFLPQQKIADRYALSGHSLILILSPENKDKIEIPEIYISEVGSSILQLARACALGERVKAEEAYKKIPDSSPSTFTRDSIARGVVVTPAIAHQSLESFARDKNSPFVARIRALINLANIENCDELLQLVKEQKKELGAFVVKYVELISFMIKGKWMDAISMSDKILNLNASLEDIWTIKARALLELGKLEDARLCLENARDISPDSLYIKNKIRELNHTQLPLDEKLKEIEETFASFPDSHDLKWQKAFLLLDKNDGLGFEKTLFDYQEFFPRMPDVYIELINWYLAQYREDLALRVLKRGRALIEAAELPDIGLLSESKAEVAESKKPGDKSWMLQEIKKGIYANDFTDIEKVDHYSELLNLEKNGVLNFLESAYFLALKIQAQIFNCNGIELEQRLKKFLPDRIIGPKSMGIDHFLESFDFLSTSRTVVQILVEWTEKLFPEKKGLPPRLRFNLALLKEQCGHLNEAEEEYYRIQEQYPQYAGSYYRVALLASQRGDFEQALISHEKAIAICPGLLGSLQELVQLNLQAGRKEIALRWQKKLCCLYPYSPRELYELLLHLHSIKGWDTVLVELEKRKEFFTANTILAFKARIYANEKRYAEARAVFETNPQIRKENEAFCLNILIDCAKEEADSLRLAELVTEGLKLYPDDLYYLALKASILKENEPETLLQFLESHLLQGNFDYQLCQYYLENSQAPGNDAIRLVRKASKSLQIGLLYAFLSAMPLQESYGDRMTFLKWADEFFPHLTDIKEELITNLNLANEGELATTIARKWYDKEPEDPQALASLAECIQDEEPEKALSLLEKEYSITSSVICLCRMARSYQIMGEILKAKNIYQRVIKRNPDDVLAICNLYLLEEMPEKLMPMMETAIKKGLGINTEYFLVATVEVARSLDRCLPVEWLDLAIEQFELIEARGGFQDEKEKLGKAISTWVEEWDLAIDANRYKPGIFSAIKLFFWPGRNWIPKIPVTD